MIAVVSSLVMASSDDEHEDDGESGDNGERFHGSIGSGRVSGAGGSSSCSHKTRVSPANAQPKEKPFS